MYVHRKMRYFFTNMAFWKNTLGTGIVLQDYMSTIRELFPFKETFEKAEYYLVYLLILFYSILVVSIILIVSNHNSVMLSCFGPP